MSYSRVSLHERDGSFLTTIHTQTERSWVLNDYGMCKFRFALTDAKALRRYLEFGTFVFIEHERLPAWGGVLDPDEDWNDDGTISMYAYAGEYLLTFRRSPLNQLFSHGSAGTLFKRMITEANKPEDLLIDLGNIWRGGTPAEDTMDGKDYYTHIKDLAKKRVNDWSIDPFINPTTLKLYFTANYYQQRGSDSSLTFKEGFNVTRRHSPLKVHRRIVNDLLGIGDGSDEERPTWNAKDGESRSRYGLRQWSEDFSSVDPGAVKAETIAKLNELKNPRRTFKLELLDIGDAFAETRLGNTHPLIMYSVGFLSDSEIGVDTNVRVIGMRYHDDVDLMELTVDEVL